MNKPFKQDSVERAMFIDYWTICQKHWLAEDNDDYWEKVVVDINEFDKKYTKQCPFASRLVTTLVEYLEDQVRKEKLCLQQ